MTTFDEYVAAVDAKLPRWNPRRGEALRDLRDHLNDGLRDGGSEEEVVARMESPDLFAEALLEGSAATPASLWRRTAAFLVDLALGGVLLGLGFMLITLSISGGLPGGLDLDSEFAILSLITMAMLLLIGSGLILSVVYFPVAEAVWGTTLGKHLFALGVASDDGTRLTWSKAIIRRLPFFFQFFWLDAVFVLFSEKRQRAFDRVAGSIVVNYP